jgi:hypothetical protein
VLAALLIETVGDVHYHGGEIFGWGTQVPSVTGSMVIAALLGPA